MLRPLFRRLRNYCDRPRARSASPSTVGLNLAQISARYVFFSTLRLDRGGDALRHGLGHHARRRRHHLPGRGGDRRAARLRALPGLQTALHVLRVALVLAFGALLAWYGFPFALSVGNQVSPAAQIPDGRALPRRSGSAVP